MFFETRKLMESSNLGYMHDLPAKFEDDHKNSRHIPIILGYIFPNITGPTQFRNYETKYLLMTCFYQKECIIIK